MPAALIEVTYSHVHDCRADAEGRLCLFAWAEHAESATCQCGPWVDERNALIDGKVFVVHKGVC